MPQDWYMATANAVSETPVSFSRATSSQDASKWIKAMQEETSNLENRGTWDIVPRPSGKRLVSNKWVFKIKTRADGSVERYKARLVARGFSQQKGVDYNETYAPVTTAETLRTMLAVATAKQLKTKHIDIKAAYLHADVEEDIYMELPEGYEIPSSARSGGGGGATRAADEQVLCCKLKKSLYGLRQAGHNWQKLLDAQLSAMGLQATESDECLYVQSTSDDDDYLIAAVYVDDVTVAYRSQATFDRFLRKLSQVVEVGTCEDLQWYLGIKVSRDATSTLMSQAQYSREVLEMHGMMDCKPTKSPAATDRLSDADCPEDGSQEQLDMRRIPYRKLLGQLQYLATCTRPDLAYAVSQLGRFSSNPGLKHWMAAKRVLRYLRGSVEAGIRYDAGDGSALLQAYCDADFAGDDEYKSTSGLVLHVAGGPVSWKSKRQRVTATSSTEAELIALSLAAKDIMYIRCLLSDIGCPQQQPTTLFEDNQAAIAIALADRRKARTRHIGVPRRFIKEQVDNGILQLSWRPGTEMVADLLTKPLGPTLFQRHRAPLMNERAPSGSTNFSCSIARRA